MLSEIPPSAETQQPDQAHTAPVPARPWGRYIKWTLLTALTIGVVAGGLWLSDELEHSRLQARHLSRYAADLSYELGKGPSDNIRFPTHGPFDERLGYVKIPLFSQRLASHNFTLTEQVRFSDPLLRYLDHGLFLPYAEKTHGGLDVRDCRGETMYRFRYPHQGYARFEDVPEVVAGALLFIENRDLLDPNRPTVNPAVDWVRFTRAALAQLGRMINEDLDAPGGSTLATQIEKYRHSPDGLTHDGQEKLRQMASASVRAYQNGEQTLPVRRRLVLDYLNTVPLSAAPRHGEVNGLGDGLWVWFGSDFVRANQLLMEPLGEGAEAAEQGQVLRQVVALMIAHRRPSWYLARGRSDLEETTSAYLRLMADNGMISAAWREAALSQQLRFRDMRANPPVVPGQTDKGSASVRTRLAGLLGTSLYELDRLDARLDATLHSDLQASVTAFLDQLTDPAFARTHGLLGDRLLSPATMGAVRYSFTLIERTPEGNKVRVQTDTTNQPLDINEGSKLELGSTAKLRVLTTYLEMVAELYERLAPLEASELRKIEVDRQDELTRWAVTYLSQASDRSLTAMLDAALDRRFSASPAESFFTGGGLHVFGNFNREDDVKFPTLRESLQASINLPFVRLMRELVRHTIHQTPGSTATLLGDDDEPRRQAYLERFADREGQAFLRRFWRKTEGRTRDGMRDMLFEGLRPTDERLAAVFRYVEPQAGLIEFHAFLQTRLGADRVSRQRAQQLYERYAPDAFDLPDRGYVARVHPLELWVVAYRMQQPGASLSEGLKASADQRQAVYRWLFRTRAKEARDSRIYTMLEVEAFLELHGRWAKLGYPFSSLVPSLATALGSSGDRPGALAELMGIIVNDGVRVGTRRLEAVRFAQGTPYETAFEQAPSRVERVMAPEVAVALRGALSDVVERGTARRLSGAFTLPDGQELAIGGKTGTGDNRVVVKGKPTLSLNRTATFVFSMGPRHFGTITAYVVGPEASRYRFTSALPVQILRSMGPTLMPQLAANPGDSCGAAAAPEAAQAAATSSVPAAAAPASAP